VQEQIEAAKGRDIYDFASGSDESSDEEDEVSARSCSSERQLSRIVSILTLRQGEFFTEGPEALLQARRKIARYSLLR